MGEEYYQKALENAANGDWTDYMINITHAIDNGNATAMINLGHMYAEGTGIEKNTIKSIEYYEMACNNGNPVMSSFLAHLYRDQCH